MTVTEAGPLVAQRLKGIAIPKKKGSFLQGESEGRIRINPSSDLLGTTLQAGHEYWSAPFSPYIVLLSRAASFHQDSPFSSFPPSHPGPPCFLLLLMRPPVLWPGKQRTLFTIDFILTWFSYARHDPLCQIIVWDHPWSLNLILSFVHRVVARNTYFSAVHPLQPKLQDLGSIRCSFWL